MDVGVWDGDNYDATINMVISYLWSYHNNLTIILMSEKKLLPIKLSSTDILCHRRLKGKVLRAV